MFWIRLLRSWQRRGAQGSPSLDRFAFSTAGDGSLRKKGKEKQEQLLECTEGAGIREQSSGVVLNEEENRGSKVTFLVSFKPRGQIEGLNRVQKGPRVRLQWRKGKTLFYLLK